MQTPKILSNTTGNDGSIVALVELPPKMTLQQFRRHLEQTIDVEDQPVQLGRRIYDRMPLTNRPLAQHQVPQAQPHVQVPQAQPQVQVPQPQPHVQVPQVQAPNTQVPTILYKEVVKDFIVQNNQDFALRQRLHEKFGQASVAADKQLQKFLKDFEEATLICEGNKDLLPILVDELIATF